MAPKFKCLLFENYPKNTPKMTKKSHLNLNFHFLFKINTLFCFSKIFEFLVKNGHNSNVDFWRQNSNVYCLKITPTYFKNPFIIGKNSSNGNARGDKYSNLTFGGGYFYCKGVVKNLVKLSCHEKLNYYIYPLWHCNLTNFFTIYL